MMLSNKGDARVSNAGFTLLEMAAAMAILIILFALGSFAVTQWIEIERSDATLEELEGLVTSCRRYYEDVESLPATLALLSVNSPVQDEWRGPYHGVDPNLRVNTGDDERRDAWGSTYLLSQSGPFEASLRSPGRDRDFDEVLDDDLVVPFNMHALARENTRRELAAINEAIERYHWVFRNYAPPLPGTLSELLDELKSKGLLTDPLGEYDTDGWGRPYQPEGTPVVRVVSAELP